MNALSIAHLTKTYANGFNALKGIDLHVEQGDFFALLGPNGAGKSTTIGIITSLVNKSSGSISVFDIDTDLQPDTVKQYIGLVPQEFNFNGFEKVKHILVTQAGFYGITKSLASTRANELLKQLGLWDKRDNTARSLSGGMKRRLMIARALVHQPKLLILDEPTAGVDIELRRSMWSFLEEINKQGTTIILTTHYLEEAENLCRNIAIIDQGRIIENTSMKSLLSRLDKETFVFYLKQSLDPSFTLNNLNYTQLDNSTLEVEFNKGDTLNLLFQQLSQQNIDVISMKNKANRLEELFIHLVEKSEATL